MGNSPLATCTLLSPNYTKGRTYNGKTWPIDTITIHCIVGQVDAQRGCQLFQSPSRNASCNYTVGKDGSIGLCVEEANRSWCTGGTLSVNGETGKTNDFHAITIEVASDSTHPYAVTDAAYTALIRLVADIAKRNGMGELKWKGDKSLVGKPTEQNMTVHRWFAVKACPGDYLYERLGDIAAKANAINREKEGDNMSEGEIRKIVADEVKNQLEAAAPVCNTVEQVPQWAREEIGQALALGILKGDGDGLGLTPQKLESALMCVRAVQAAKGGGGNAQ